MGTNILLKGRLGFPHLYQPSVVKNTDSKPAYSCQLYLDKKDSEFSEYARLIYEAIEEAKAEGVKTKKGWAGEEPEPLDIKWLKDGDKLKGKKKRPETDGHLVVAARSPDRPGVVDANLQKIIDEKKVYAGCYVYLQVNIFPYDTGSNGIGCCLNNVMYVKDGEPLAGKESAESAFGEVAGKVPQNTKSNPLEGLL
jgi:hypothetical protein